MPKVIVRRLWNWWKWQKNSLFLSGCQLLLLTVVEGSNLVSIDIVCDCRIFDNISIRSNVAVFVIFDIQQNSSPTLDFLLSLEAIATFSDSPKMRHSATRHFDQPQPGPRTSTPWTTVKIFDCFVAFFRTFLNTQSCAIFTNHWPFWTTQASKCASRHDGSNSWCWNWITSM